MNKSTDNVPAPTFGGAQNMQSGYHRGTDPDAAVNILIVDDEPKNLTVLETILDGPGYDLVRAGSADEALLALVREEFAVLILDIRMPGMSGIELAQMIRERKKTARVPIIFLTAYYNEDQHVLEGYGTGAVDYLHKPVNPAILRSKVAVFAELYRKNRECGIANRALLTKINERRRAQEQLRELNETLEQRVNERTQALRASEERFHVMAENIPQLAWMANAEGYVDWFNQRWLDYTGTTLEENQGAGWKAVHHPDYVDAVAEKFERHLRKCIDWEDTFPLRGRDGRYRWFLSRMKAIRDESGKVVRFFGTNTDITEQREIEQALRESDERYRTLFHAAPMAVFVCDRHSVIQQYNRHAVVLWGREPVCGVEQHCGSVKLWLPDGTRLPHTQSPIVEVLRTGIPSLNVEVFIERPDGSRLPVLVNFAALKNAQGEITGAITSFVDISESKRAESELRAAKATAEQANRAKSDFLSSMSHDLRTPLGAILGFAQLLESGSPPPTSSQKRSIDQILKAGWYLLELISEILDLALIESGKLSVSMEAISLAAILHECATMMGPQMRTRDITVKYPRFDIPYSVRGDRTRLKQVLINLLSNAIKYNRVGGAIDVAFCANTPGRIRIEVKDTGEGMTPDKLAQLFQPFNRLGKEESAEEGTGIGLVLTKRLVELMGGAIGVESTAGVGSVFWIDLSLATEPLPAARAAELTAAPPADIQSGAQLRTLLYVEDNPENMILFEALIAHRQDIRLLTAMNANRGIEIARAAVLDVILMDIKMPGMSGIEALTTLREDPSTLHIPIIALSANAMPDDIEKCLALGFFRYLTKPIKFNELMDTLDAALNWRKMQPTNELKKEDA